MTPIRTLADRIEVTRKWFAKAAEHYDRPYIMKRGLEAFNARLRSINAITDEAVRRQEFRALPSLEYYLNDCWNKLSAPELLSLSQQDRAQHGRGRIDGMRLDDIIVRIFPPADPWCKTVKQYWKELKRYLDRRGYETKLVPCVENPKREILKYRAANSEGRVTFGHFENRVSVLRKTLPARPDRSPLRLT